MMGKMEAMLRELRITVVTPAPVASSAAMILVSIPPVPSDVPRVDVLTEERKPSKEIIGELGGFAQGESSSHEQGEEEERSELTIPSHGLDIINDSHRLGFWVLPRVIGVEAVYVGHQKEVVGVNLGEKGESKESEVESAVEAERREKRLRGG